MAMSDTHPMIRARLDAAYRGMTPAQKIGRMVALTQTGYVLALARIRAEHPDESERQHRQRLCARWLSREQVCKAFGWDPLDPSAKPPR